MTPPWVQAFLSVASLSLVVSLVVSIRRRSWNTLLGRVSRDEQPIHFWTSMAVGFLITLMFLALAIGSVFSGL